MLEGYYGDWRLSGQWKDVMVIANILQCGHMARPPRGVAGYPRSGRVNGTGTRRTNLAIQKNGK
jgi:hypothetical protein